jgi:transcriptional regulator of acetoin/glycerol metabolism
MIFKEDKRIKTTDLPLEITRNAKLINGHDNNHSALSESEIKLITDALKSAGWNQSRAAARLGIPRHVLIYRMRKYNIREE